MYIYIFLLMYHSIPVHLPFLVHYPSKLSSIPHHNQSWTGGLLTRSRAHITSKLRFLSDIYLRVLRVLLFFLKPFCQTQCDFFLDKLLLFLALLYNLSRLRARLFRLLHKSHTFSLHSSISLSKTIFLISWNQLKICRDIDPGS